MRFELESLLLNLLDEVRQIGAQEEGAERLALTVVQLALALLAVQADGVDPVTPHGRLTGAQVGQLQGALADAFTRETLAQMVRIRLDENLERVVGSTNLNDMAFELVAWAERMGRTDELVAGACAANPRNRRLREAAQALGVTLPDV